MKHLIIGLVSLAAILGLASCDEQRTIFEGAPRVLFADTLSVCPALQDNKEFPIHIASMRACDYDRTYAVEIVANKSKAVYNWHYKLDRQTVTLRAGETVTTLNVQPIYDNIEDTDSLGFQLQLISQLDDAWSEQGMTTKVILQKVCPFDVNNFTGYCRVRSRFLSSYLNVHFRTFRCEPVEGEPNRMVFRNFYADNFDIKVQFDDSDPLHPTLNVVDEQQIADARDVFLIPYGDNRILVSNAPGYTSSFNACQRTADMYLLLRVDQVGTIGAYINSLEWIEDHEL